MSSPATRLAHVEQIFFEVAALAPGDREAAIVRLCLEDADLQAEVRAMLASAADLGAFLENPVLGKPFDQLAAESGTSPVKDELMGAALGNFRVERRLASGGMGTVYLASRSDGQFEQRVAIKVVKRGMDSEEILRRFRLERQTLAALDHPNIARLIDGGMTKDGRPFLVMEYVEGMPIDQFCDDKSLSLRERLALFRQVCDAVHHAHQNLVIHRDLKPSNILVTAQGVPKLLDFGISKLISGGTGQARSVTADTDRRLTPEYASPEQVEGASLSTASDVYALGVVLYELLTGARPYHFSLKTSEEVRRVICTLVPLPPSQAITVRASRLRTTAPPASAPVPPTAPETLAPQAPPVDVPKTRGVSSTRLRTLLRGDLDTIVLMALRKEPHRRYASAEQFSADIGRYLGGLPVQARKDTLGYRGSKFIRRHAASVASAGAAFVLLTGATILLYNQSRELRRQKAEVIATNQRLDENLKRLEESRRFLQTVISGADTANQGPDAKLGDVLKDAATALRNSPPADPLTLAAAEAEAGRAMMSLGMLADAKPLLEDADRLYATLPPDSDARLDSSLSLAELAFYDGRAADAEKQFTVLLAAERSRNKGVPTVRETTLLNNLGSSLRLQGKTDDSIATQRQALAATIAVLGARSLGAAQTRNNLASSLLQKGDTAAAVEEFSKAYEVRQALLRPDHPLLVRCQSNLGLAKLRAGQVEEAVTLLTQAAESWETAFGPEHPGRIAAIISLSQALRKQGKQDQAIDWLRRALAWQQAHQPANALDIAATQANIGLALAEKGDAAAIDTLERALPAIRDGGLSALARAATESLATLYETRGDLDRAHALRGTLK